MLHYTHIKIMKLIKSQEKMSHFHVLGITKALKGAADGVAPSM